MEITKGSDLILVLQIEDYKSRPMRVADCADFRLYVWTANRNNFLQFTKREINQDGQVDKIAIPSFMMDCLESGVICYTYAYSKYDDNFKESDHYYDKCKIHVTDLYWRNCNLNEVPKNPVNYQTLSYLRDLIENEANAREIGDIQVKQYLTEEYIEKLQEEINRSNAVDIEFHKMLKKLQSDAADKNAELDNTIEDIKGEAEATADSLNQTIDKLNAEIKRSTNKDSEIDDKLDTEIIRASNAEQLISNKLDSEIERSRNTDTSLRDAIDLEISRAKDKEQLIDNKVNELNTAVNTAKDALAAEIARSTDKDTEHANALAAEVGRATAKENEIAANLDTEVIRAKDAEKHISDDLHDEIDRAKEAEDVISSIVSNEINRSMLKDGEIEDAIDEIKREKNAIDTALAVEIARAKAAEKANSDAIDAEVSRAKQVEGEITAALTAEKTRSMSKDTAHDEAINAVSIDLAAEVSRAKTAEKVNADALAVVNGDEDTIGSIAHALADANHYTDDEIAKVKAQTATDLSDALKPYATKTEVDDRIETLIGTAPEKLDTLGEIAEALDKDSDAIAAINGVLAGKANSADVYTKTEVDTALAALSNKDSELDTALNNEVSRAKAAEKINADALAIVNGDADTIGSIAHALADANHYTDDEIAALRAEQNINLANFATKNELAEIDGKLSAHKAEAAETYVKAEAIEQVNADIAEINNALGDCATAEELAAVHAAVNDKANAADVYTKDEIDETIEGIDGELENVYTKTEVDTALADKADSAEVYTKAQVDELIDALPKLVSLSQEDYDALDEIDDNTLYIIL